MGFVRTDNELETTLKLASIGTSPQQLFNQNHNIVLIPRTINLKKLAVAKGDADLNSLSSLTTIFSRVTFQFMH